MALGTRQRIAAGMCVLAVWCLPALALGLPNGLLGFGLLLLASTVLVPGMLIAGAREIAVTLKPLLWLVLVVLLVGLASVLWFDLGLREIDNLSRMLVMPWCMLSVYVLRPPRIALWRGALAGIAAAAVLAIWQVLGGLERAQGWSNAIVFADIVLALMVLAVFCRPCGRWCWTAAVLGLGLLAILLSGSRGAWPGVLVVLVALALTSGWRSPRTRLLLLGAICVCGVTTAFSVPVLSGQMRLDELQQDIDRFGRGDLDTSTGARLERLALAMQTFTERPLTGLGLGQFDRAMMQLPECRGDGAPRCHWGHAHNDLGEWAATLGLPGVLALIALYGWPLRWFTARIWRASERLRGAAAAGAMLVIVYVLCGLTQSMFAHQLTAGFYAATLGVLFGLALRETGLD